MMTQSSTAAPTRQGPKLSPGNGKAPVRYGTRQCRRDGSESVTRVGQAERGEIADRDEQESRRHDGGQPAQQRVGHELAGFVAFIRLLDTEQARFTRGEDLPELFGAILRRGRREGGEEIFAPADKLSFDHCWSPVLVSCK
jgi:hypothetical protein